MNRRQLAALVVAALTVCVVAAGTGGFTSVEADRLVSVTVADDAEAYLGYQSASPVEVNDSTGSLALVVTNRFDESVTVTAATTHDDVQVTPSSDSVAPGESLQVSLACSGPTASGTVDVPVTLVAEGTSVSVEMERTVSGVELDCP